MEEILTIFITIMNFLNVTNGTEAVNMIGFGGHAESEWFVGDVLPGGVDTQRYSPDVGTLSARYMLQGVDCDGDSCKIFIENNMTFGHEFSTPRIITDSEALEFLNHADLKGRIDMNDGNLTIRVLCPENLIEP